MVASTVEHLVVRKVPLLVVLMVASMAVNLVAV